MDNRDNMRHFTKIILSQRGLFGNRICHNPSLITSRSTSTQPNNLSSREKYDSCINLKDIQSMKALLQDNLDLCTGDTLSDIIEKGLNPKDYDLLATINRNNVLMRSKNRISKGVYKLSANDVMDPKLIDAQIKFLHEYNNLDGLISLKVKHCSDNYGVMTYIDSKIKREYFDSDEFIDKYHTYFIVNDWDYTIDILKGKPQFIIKYKDYVDVDKWFNNVGEYDFLAVRRTLDIGLIDYIKVDTWKKIIKEAESTNGLNKLYELCGDKIKFEKISIQLSEDDKTECNIINVPGIENIECKALKCILNASQLCCQDSPIPLTVPSCEHNLKESIISAKEAITVLGDKRNYLLVATLLSLERLENYLYHHK